MMDGGGGGVSSNGSMSTVSKEDNLVMVSSEVSSSYPDESELELGLGLSLGCGGGRGGGGSGGSRGSNVVKSSKTWGQGGGGRILTAQDFPTAAGSKAVSSSSSSSSPTATKAIGNSNAFCGTKRNADSFSPPRSGVSQVVGWPPVRAYRMNSLINQAKSPTSEVCASTNEKSKNKSPLFEKNDGIMNGKNNDSQTKDISKSSHFVKVYMDGIPIGRKVDLNAHNSYETLARALDDMFCTPSNAVGARS
ncbi:OLC1v1006923C3 [Oldenlandia corymbosa var. corymbosa]|uniref:Auxin-responsive protein n=1 Tax=Oldenlandia corymbosa var. corymbosa TaxID=529605 RepID=A0AAV1DKW0_OLDCO|nr:OLC1v1006923C3 [Oldenlandia corymbosa var. corymbosa]